MSELQQRAETSLKDKKTADARYHFIRAYEDYMNKGNYQNDLVFYEDRPLSGRNGVRCEGCGPLLQGELL